MAVLALYLNHSIGYTEDYSTYIFHLFIMLAYGLPVIGAIVCDSWLGKFNTIFYMSIVYCVGSIMVTLSSFRMLNLPAELFAVGGLVIIAIGSAGIKPCVVAFGADQYELPEQKKDLSLYFSVLYICINAGALLPKYLAPVFREDVHCFGDKECFPLALGASTFCMLGGVVVFGLGFAWYKIIKPIGNMLVLISHTIYVAIVNKWKSTEKRDHWLDYAEPKYDKQLIADIKVLTRVIVLFIPLPAFWALFDQQGSRWTFQATRMDGDLGLFEIKPDQIQIANPLLITILVPIFKFAIYPALEIIHIQRPLQKMTIGGFITALSFVVSAILELQLEKTYPVLPQPHNAQLRMYNGESCDYTITTNIAGQESFILKALDAYVYKDIDVPKETFKLEYSISSSDASCPTYAPTTVEMKQETAYSIFLNSKDTNKPIYVYEDNVNKPKHGLPYGRTLPNVKTGKKISWFDVKHGDIDYEEPINLHKQTEFSTGLFQIMIDDDKSVFEFEMYHGGSYVVVINEVKDGTYDAKVHELTQPNSIHMLWILPQYVVLTSAEIMLNINLMEFTYGEAPISLKAILMACRLLTNSLGNGIVAIIAYAKFFKSQANEFFLFAIFMALDMCLFVWLAHRYIPRVKVEENKAGDKGK